MTTIKLDPVTHDLDLSSGNLELIDGVDEIAQKLRIRYQFFLGEWFLDQRQGIPYFQKIFVKPFNKTDTDAILREVAETTPGIVEVNRFDSTFDGVTRGFTVALWAKSDTGEPIDFNEPFILRGTP